MPKFSKRSKNRLNTCQNDLVILFEEVVKHFDCSIICGHRGEKAQNRAYPKYSKVKYPNSKHNSEPSLAVDVYPYPVNLRDTARFYYFAGFVKGIANKLGIKIRWGGDWDSDFDVRDQTFNDLGHFELI